MTTRKESPEMLRTVRVSCALSLVVAVAAFGVACKAAEETEPEAVVTVTVATAVSGDVEERVEAPGTVGSASEATVSPKISAQILEMGTLEGARVSAGDTIAVLEAADLRSAAAEADAAVREADAALAQTRGGTNAESDGQRRRALADAEATLQNAESVYRRKKTLVEQGGAARKDLEEAELALATARNQLELAKRESSVGTATMNYTNIRVAESRLDQARERAASAHAQLGYATIRSPISGVITGQFHHKGDFVPAGEKLVSIVGTADLVVKARIPDRAAPLIAVGSEATVTLGSDPTPLSATVRLVDRSVDPGSRTIEVWVGGFAADASLQPGSFAKVEVVTSHASGVVTVPPDAVSFEEPGAEAGTVMVVDDTNTAHEVHVTVGVRGRDALEITEGLAEGSTVIIVGNHALPDGTKVRPVGADEPEEHEESP